MTTLFDILSCFCIMTLINGDTILRRPLDQFISHYEHVHYDETDLIHRHHRLRRSSTAGKDIKLTFTAFNRQFDLRLFPDDKYFHKDSVFHDSKGEISKSHTKAYLYSGLDSNNPSIKVLGSLAFGVFDGKIRDGDEVYYIEPSNRYLNESVAESHSIIYRMSDVDMSQVLKNHPESTPCGATTHAQERTLSSLMQESVVNRRKDDTQRLHRRQSPDSSLIRCSLNIIADYKFYSKLTTAGESTTLRQAQAASLIRMIVGDGSENFENQDFNGDEVPDGIHFSIFNLTIETEPPPDSSPFSNDFLGAAAYLDEHSSEDWSQYCLSYRFTYRDFDQGVLGLAFVAASGSRGGICDDFRNSQTFNTGIVTLLNFNARITNVVAGLTFTHEAGHNFGSQHDPATSECQPSNNNGGKFVMFDRANDGSRSNNRNFSPCSKEMMLPQIQSRGQRPNSVGCFISAENDCGNDLVDEGEACDCGLNYNSETMLCNEDPCCNGTSCTLANNVECSPGQGVCCFDNCTFVDESFLCREEEDCALSQTCNGTSAVCPVSEPRPSNTSVIMCTTDTNMTRFCLNGACEGSICIPLGLKDCECTEEEKQCHVCCLLEDERCESTIVIAETNDTARDLLPDGVGQVLDIGFPCNDLNGYCNFFNMCQLIDTNGALRRITNAFLNNEAVRTIVEFFRQYWWAPIVGAVVIVIGLFLLVLCCHFILPRPKHMKKRAERRKSIRQSRRGRNRINHGYSGYPEEHVPMRHY